MVKKGAATIRIEYTRYSVNFNLSFTISRIYFLSATAPSIFFR